MLTIIQEIAKSYLDIRCRFMFNLTLTASLFCSVSVMAQNEEEDELKNIRGKIHELRKDLKTNTKKRNTANRNVQRSEKALNSTNKRLNNIYKKKNRYSKELTALKQKTNALTGKIEIEKKRLSALIYNQYISGKFESIQFLLTHEDPNEIARQFHYLQFVSEARTKLIRSLRQNLA